MAREVYMKWSGKYNLFRGIFCEFFCLKIIDFDFFCLTLPSLIPLLLREENGLRTITIIRMHTLSNVKTQRDVEKSQCIGFTSNALPEVQKLVLAENSQTGVSTQNGQSGATSNISKKKSKETPHWYVLRVTYGREKNAYDYLVEKGVEAFYPTIMTVKIIDGKRKPVKESRFPNIFFARGTEEQIKAFVYDNENLPYLRFYYRHFHKGTYIIKEPLIVPDCQMESLKKICDSEAKDIIIKIGEIPKFKAGVPVRVIDGCFMGVVGRVARYHGQQRVAVFIENLCTIVTAYIPSAFLEEIT